MEERPDRISICHESGDDDWSPGRGRYVGTTSDGRQFFITTPFVPGNSPRTFSGEDFVALYMWRGDGEFESGTVERVATRESESPLPGSALPAERYQAGIEKLLSSLGEVEFCDIEVSPFAFEFLGVKFGLVAWPPEDEDEEWHVTAEPGDYMSFHPPWDGDYET